MKHDYDKRQELAQQTAIIQALRRMGRGVGAIRKDPRKLAILLALWALVPLLWAARYALLDYTANSLLAPFCDLAMVLSLALLVVAVPTALSWAWGGPLRASKVQDNLRRIGFVNTAGEPPTLLSISLCKENRKVKVMEFFTIGIPASTWLDCADKIQAALNITVADVRYGKDNQHIELYAAKPAASLPKNLLWQDRLLLNDDFSLILGESLVGPVIWDPSAVPHALLGGVTRSGKSNLLCLLLRQAYLKGAEVYIADFKGGVDFGRWWEEHCKVCYDLPALVEMLTHLVEVLEERKILLHDADCKNISVYNAQTLHPLPRKFFACDEVAAVLGGTWRHEKKLLDQVIGQLSYLAQQGAAFGLHLVLATQRPDATIIPGQIKSNIDFKVCGRADSILSTIIIDSTAADLIPAMTPGRFVLNDGMAGMSYTVFQAYYLDNSVQ